MYDRCRESSDGRNSDAACQEADCRDAHDWRCGRDHNPEELDKNKKEQSLVLYYPQTETIQAYLCEESGSHTVKDLEPPRVSLFSIWNAIHWKYDDRRVYKPFQTP